MKPKEKTRLLTEAYNSARKAIHEKCIDLCISSEDTEALLKSIPPPPIDPPGGQNPHPRP